MNIYDIAQKAGVSIATVSRVINDSTAVSEKTREKVNKVMLELGYSPNIFARGLMGSSMKTFGIMTIDVRNVYFSDAIHTIELETRRLGYNIFLCSTGENLDDKKKYLKLLLRKKVDGIILIGSVFKEKNDNSHIIESARQVPVVMINGYVSGDNIHCITCDDSYGIFNAVNYLVNKGHKNLIYMYDVDTFSGYEKIKGFKKAINENNLEITQNSIIKVEKDIDGTYRAVGKLLEEKHKFSAVITSEDILAVGVLKRLKEAGMKVPEDVAVVGFNNSIIARCTAPELTSVDAKVESISSSAVKLLSDALEGKNVPSKTTVLPDLVIRGSA